MSNDSITIDHRIFSKQLFTELRSLEHIPLDAELERYFQSRLKGFNLAMNCAPSIAEQQRMRLNTLAYLGTDLEHSPEYIAMHEFTRNAKTEFEANLKSGRTHAAITTKITLKIDESNNISIIKGVYEESLNTYTAYMAIDHSSGNECVLAAVFMAPEIFAVESMIVGTFEGTFVFDDPRATELLDEELLPRLLGGACGYDGIRVASTINPEGLNDMGNLVNFAYKHGGAVYVFDENAPGDTVYLVFNTLEEYDRGISYYYGKYAAAGNWALLISYKPLPAGSKVQRAVSASDDDGIDNNQAENSSQVPEMQSDESHNIYILQFKLTPPDTDGDMRVSAEVMVRNATPLTVHLIRTHTVYINKDGIIISSDRDNYEQEKLLPGEFSSKFDPVTSYVKAGLCGSKRNDVCMRVFATLYSREFHKLGEIKIPHNNNQHAILRATLNSTIIAPEINLLLLRNAPDDDGSIRIDIRCGVVNTTDQYIDKIILKSSILDEEDEVIEDSKAEKKLLPQTAICIEYSFRPIKKSRLRGAYCRFSLSVFTPVQREVCDAISTLDD